MMAHQRILVVEDEADIAETIRYNLERDGYRVDLCESGEDAMTRLSGPGPDLPDLILLDLMLPGMDGISVCKRLRSREHTRAIPIVMVTAMGTESDVVTGLETGADDYVVKPFSPRVLTARVAAVLRRTAGSKDDGTGTLSVHGVTVDPGRHKVTAADGHEVSLTATEFGILHFLARHPGWVYTRSQIVDGVKGSGHPVTERSVDVQIVSLRKKLGDASPLIETVRGVGYRIKDV